MNTVLAAVGAVAAGAILAMLGEEVSTRLGLFPRMLIRAAVLLVPRSVRRDYADEYLAELDAITSSRDGLPLSRLAHGVRYALGVCYAAWMVSRTLGRKPASAAASTAWSALLSSITVAVTVATIAVGALGLPAVVTVTFANYIGEELGRAIAYRGAGQKEDGGVYWIHPLLAFGPPLASWTLCRAMGWVGLSTDLAVAWFAFTVGVTCYRTATSYRELTNISSAPTRTSAHR